MIFQRISLWNFWLGGIIDAKNAKLKGIAYKKCQTEGYGGFHFAVFFRCKLTTLADPIFVEMFRRPSWPGDVQRRIDPKLCWVLKMNLWYNSNILLMVTLWVTSKFNTAMFLFGFTGSTWWIFNARWGTARVGALPLPTAPRRSAPLRGVALSVGPKPPDAEVGAASARAAMVFINSYGLGSRFWS